MNRDRLRSRLTPRPPLRKSERGSALAVILLIGLGACRTAGPPASIPAATDTALVFTSPEPTTAVDTVRQMVARLYVEYIPLTAVRDSVQSSVRFVRAHPDYFAYWLASAFEGHEADQAKHPGEVVGPDFDPISASQDPCEGYVPRKVWATGNEILVEVHCAQAGVPSAQPSLTVVVARVSGSWRIVDLIYPSGERITRLLAAYLEHGE